MRILHVSPEVAPWAGTGGLGEVVGSLPAALAALGHSVSVFLPLYRSARARGGTLTSTGTTLEIPVGDRTVAVPVWRSTMPGSDVEVLFLEHDPYYNREGLYGTSAGDYKDNSERFLVLSRAALEWAARQTTPFDVVHAHDWQAALVPVYLRTLYRSRPALAKTRSVLTLHNLAFQGVFWHWDMKLTGLDWSLFNWRQLEFYGKLNFLKGGIVFADAVTTVSPRYAREIQGAEFGCGLEGVLRGRVSDLHGILNGIDTVQWDPAHDPHLAANYAAGQPKGKAQCKRALQRACGLAEDAQVPLFGMISRLTEQKGLDLLEGALPELARRPLQLVVLGSGEARYERMLQDAARRWPDRIHTIVAFDIKKAHEIEAGADVFLMPSRFEPCGLNQMYSLRYGTIPIVREVGGLADTVIDANPLTLARGTATGFMFSGFTGEALLGAVTRTLDTWQEPETWETMMRSGMAQDFSWQRSAGEYVRLYEALKTAPTPPRGEHP